MNIIKLWLVAAGGVLIFLSCGSIRRVPLIEQRDSVRVEYRDSLVVRDSIVYVTLPMEQSVGFVHHSDTSYLETSLAESEAWVDSSGLHHTLHNKQRQFGVTVPVVTHTVQAIAHTQSLQTHVVTEEKPLSRWQRLRLKAFWWLILLCIIGFRKEIRLLVKLFS